MARWYIIHAYSGFENKVKEAILADAARLGLEQLVEAVEALDTDEIAELCREVHAAGGQLVVAPNFDEAVVAEAMRRGLLCLPGVMTPSEAFAALASGAHGLKLFPAELMTPAAVKALRAVLPNTTRLLPVGGITPDTMAPYRAAGANGFGIGSALYKPGMTAEQVQEQARRFKLAWSQS